MPVGRNGVTSRDLSTIRELEHELQSCRYRQEKMKRDFEYNLKLLEERDTELEHYDRMFAEYSTVLKSRDEDVSRLKAKIAQCASALDDEKRLRLQAEERLTTEATEQREAATRTRAELQDVEQSLGSRVDILQDNLTAKHRELSSLQSKTRSTELSLKESRETEKSLRVRIETLKENAERQCRELVSLRESAKSSKQALDAYEEKFEALSRRIRTIDADRTWEIENERQTCEKRLELSRRELADVSDERDALRGTIKELEATMSNQMQDVEAQTQATSRWKLKLEQVMATSNGKEEELASCQRRNRELSQENTDLEVETSRKLEKQKLEFQTHAEELRQAVTTQRDSASREKAAVEKRVRKLELELSKAQLPVTTPSRRSSTDQRVRRSGVFPEDISRACPSSLLNELDSLRSRNTSLEEQLTKSDNEARRHNATALRTEVCRLKQQLEEERQEVRRLADKQRYFADERNRLLDISNKLKSELNRHQSSSVKADVVDVYPYSVHARVDDRGVRAPSHSTQASDEVTNRRSTPAAASSFPSLVLTGRGAVRRRFGL